MAEFRIHSLEGMQYVDAHLKDETITAEAGAFCYSTGKIDIRSKLIPSVFGVLRSLLSEEAIFRPTYSGTGVVTMESSFGGFHLLELRGDFLDSRTGYLLGIRGRCETQLPPRTDADVSLVW